MKDNVNGVYKCKHDRRSPILWGVVFICAVEYIGIGQYIPGIQSITIFLLGLGFLSLFSFERLREVFANGQTRALIIFFVHTGLSVSYAVVKTYAFLRFKLELGYILLFLVTYMAMKSMNQIRIVMASMAVLHCGIIVTNLDKLNMSMGIRATGYRAGYFLGDANDLAWSLCIFLPFVIYFMIFSRSKAIKGLSIIGISLFLFGIVGTGSRGSFLALAASIGYLILNSQKKGRAILAAFILSACVFALAPSTYFDRMKTIESFEEDSSALGRMMAWKAAIRMAVDNPLGVGAGNFNAAYGRFYRNTEHDPMIYAASRWISAHSIYFQVLGEFGFLGLITIITLLFLNFRTNQLQWLAIKDRRLSDWKGAADNFIPKYLNMCLVSYCTGGFFLSGIYYPHLFILTALILKTRKLLKINQG